MSSESSAQPSPASPSQSKYEFDVSVLIVTYNSEDQIVNCLGSVFEEADTIRQEVIVVDNNSTDNTVALIKENFPQVKLHIPGENMGFAKAVNFAAKQSRASHFLLLNPDTVVLENAIDRVFKFAVENPEYGYYGGRTLKDDHSLERSSCWGQPTLWSLFLFASGISTIFRDSALLDPESIGGWQRDSIREVGVITGCFLLASREAWERIDGFDEHFWLYGEDADLAMRARKSGYKPVIYPEAVVVHEVGQSSTSAQKMIWLYRGKVSLIKKHWSGLSRSLSLGFLKFGVFIRSLAYGAMGKSESHWVQGWKRRQEWQDGHPQQVG